MIKLIISLLTLFVTITNCAKISYENYKIYTVSPLNKGQISLLHSVRQVIANSTRWDEIIHADLHDFIVPPTKVNEFEQFLNNYGIGFNVTHNNIQRLIDQESVIQFTQMKNEFVSSYHTLKEIYYRFKTLRSLYPDKVKIADIGKSYKQRPVAGLVLFAGENKPRVFIEGGIHAREWISTATVVYLIEELLTSKAPEVRNLTRNYEFHLFPTVNPDGYIYTHMKDRLWRKTRKPHGDSKCLGADMNRNFAIKWNGVGSENNECSEIYAGNAPFSEPEARHLANYILSIQDGLFAYFSLHSYGQKLMFPYGYTKRQVENYDELLDIGRKAVRSLEKRYGTKYTVGSIVDIMYPASGSTIDWVKKRLNLPITYAYELRSKNDYFVLPANQIVPNGEEFLDSLITILKEGKKYGHP